VPQKKVDTPNFGSEDRDQIILKVIEHEEKMRHANSHLGSESEFDGVRPYTYWSEDPFENERGYDYWSELNKPLKDTRLSLVVCPAWGVIFPPYNVARLTSLLRENGYEINVHDANIEGYHFLKGKLKKDMWDAIYHDHWYLPAYDIEIHPTLKPFLDNLVLEILETEPGLVGFSVYNTNLHPTGYVMNELKKANPNIRIVIGGPEVLSDWMDGEATEKLRPELQEFYNNVDYRVIGEGEEEILNLLENLDEYPIEAGPYSFGNTQSRLDLNQLPFPDYSDFSLNLYRHPDGVSIESSRGCVAQCTFCSETWFWKFRWRESIRVIEEMKHQIKKYRIKRFWFVDSLINGNLKEFRKLVDQIVADGLDIRWNSYARCDGRMDREFFDAVAASGCSLLSFGVEAGSEKVLLDMKKRIKVWEIENNLRDCRASGIETHVNWVIGFPTERPVEWLHSLHVLYNSRKWVFVLSPGMTCGDAVLSDIHINWDKYDIAWKEQPWDNTFMSNWYTQDYVNTVIHRFIRLKFANQWLKMMVTDSDGTVINAQQRPNMDQFFEFEQENPGQFIDYIPQEQNQNFNVFKGATPQEQLASSLANEYLPYVWVTYKVYGAHTFKIINDPEKDLEEFGGGLATVYDGEVIWNVDADGNFEFSCNHSFSHETTNDDSRVKEHEIKREDMSFAPIEFKLSGNISQFNGEKNEDSIDTSPKRQRAVAKEELLRLQQP